MFPFRFWLHSPNASRIVEKKNSHLFKSFQQNHFLRGPVGIDLYTNINTYGGKTVYIYISSDPTKSGPH